MQSFFFSADHAGFWWIKLIGITVGLTLIPVLFYTLGGAFGKLPDWINILIFFLSAGVAYYVEYRIFKGHRLALRGDFVPIVLLLFLTGAFVLLTYCPPKIPLFQDPITRGYGLKK